MSLPAASFTASFWLSVNSCDSFMSVPGCWLVSQQRQSYAGDRHLFFEQHGGKRPGASARAEVAQQGYPEDFLNFDHVHAASITRRRGGNHV